MSRVADADARAVTQPEASASPSLPPSSSPSTSALLFSLQLFVADVRLSATPTASSSALLLGFQLLPFEIVLFERRELLDGGSRLAVAHGKACLFEAEPAALAAQLRDEGGAPLVLLLMEQERDRARLVAFASVPLPLHVGLTADNELPADMRYRVCEWAGGGGSWGLCNHQGDAVGTATGAVTLSCLGKTLAPHLQTALGVQVGCAPNVASVCQALSASLELCGGDSAAKQQDQPTVVAGADQGGRPEDKVSDGPTRESARADAAVQCESEDATSDGQDGQRRRPEAVCLVGSRRERQRRGGFARRSASVVDAGRGHSTPERCELPRFGAHDESASRSTHPPAPASAGGVIPPRSLPPPLFFQKQPVSRKR